MLISLRGRRTGREFTLPVEYADDGDAIWVLAAHPERKNWWRNLASETCVGLRYRGMNLSATARAFLGDRDPERVEQGLRAYLRRFPRSARVLGIEQGEAGIVEGSFEEAARRTVVVRILLHRDREIPFLRAANEPPIDGKGLVGAVRRHPLGAFYALTFLASWGGWIPNALAGGHVSHFPGLTGPLIGAVVVTALTGGRAGLSELASRLVRFRVPFRWYPAAVAPLAVALGTMGIMVLAGARAPRLRELGRMPGLPDVGLLGTFLLTLLVNGYGEEVGWRGFALPRFRRFHRELQSSVLIAIPWLLWHVPTFFLDSGYRGMNPLILPGFVLGIFAGSIVLTWIYEGSGASLFIAALWHTTLNLGSATEAGEGAIAVVVTAFVIAAAFVIARVSWKERDRLPAAKPEER